MTKTHIWYRIAMALKGVNLKDWGLDALVVIGRFKIWHCMTSRDS